MERVIGKKFKKLMQLLMVIMMIMMIMMRTTMNFLGYDLYYTQTQISRNRKTGARKIWIFQFDANFHVSTFVV